MPVIPAESPTETSLALALEEELAESRILIVDDAPTTLTLLDVVLRESGFSNIEVHNDPRSAAARLDEQSHDLVLVDMHMPHLSGLDLVARIRGSMEHQNVPVLMLTGDSSERIKQAALASGAKDFLAKPFDSTELILRVRNLLETRHMYRRLILQNELLEQSVAARTADLEDARRETLERLALAAEFRDDATGAHTTRVGRTGAMIAEALNMRDTDADLVEQAAPLHDIGKIGVPDSILLKPGPLTKEEFESMKQHTGLGARLLSGSSSPVLQLAETIAFTHHERWDGRGYEGMRGDEIPLSGRITAVADVYDALVHQRPYKGPWSVEHAVDEIRREAGRQFDPDVVGAFLEVVDEVDLSDPHPVPAL